MTASICVINAKGGCGKTTISTHVAAALSSSGLDTSLADWDRHRGATHWLSLRPKSSAKIRLADWRKSFGAIPKKTQRLVIDCPASLKSQRVREVAATADVLIVPILPSVFDEYATKVFLTDLDKIKKIRKGQKKVLVIANRFKANTIAGRRLSQYLEDLDFPANHYISERSIYPQLAARGLSAFDLHTKPMAERQMEWMGLIRDIEDVIRNSKGRSKYPKNPKNVKKSRKNRT